jgi:hypothetical protein
MIGYFRTIRQQKDLFEKKLHGRGFFQSNGQSERMFSKTVHTIYKIPIVSQGELVDTESRLCFLPIDSPVIS